MTSVAPDAYVCPICSKTYKIKINYNRHNSYCEFLYKSKQERENDADLSNDVLPTMGEMYKWMQTMALRIDKLEKDNASLKQTQKKKIHLLEWLNGATRKDLNPILTFSMWVNQNIIPFVHEYLELVYKTDLLNGMTQLFDRALSGIELEQVPICAFESKPNTLYIYKKILDETTNAEKTQWIYITNSDFDTYLSIISHQFLVEFNTHWYSKHKEKIHVDETYKETYVNYYKSVLGGDRMSDESRNHRIRQHLNKAAKRNIKNITEYDIC